MRPIPLDPTSEGIFDWEEPGFPQTIAFGFTFRGEVEPEAMAAAIVEAQETRPHLHAFLKPIRTGLRAALAWHIQDAPCGLEVVDESDDEAAPADMEAWFLETTTDDTTRIRDLQTEYPARFRLFLLPEKIWCLEFACHHVAVDGAKAWGIVRDIFSAYHRRVTGSAPAWADVPAFHSQAGEFAPVDAPTTGEYLPILRRERKRYPFAKVAQIASVIGGAPGRLIVRQVIDDPAEQEAIRRAAREAGGSVSDLFTAAMMGALDEWNASRGEPPTVMLHGMAVNQRLRRRYETDALRGNPMSMIGVPSDREHRRTPAETLAHVVETRTAKLAAGHDVALGILGEKLRGAVRWMPIGLRRRLLRKITVSPLSAFVTNPGILWPEIDGERLTGQTVIREVGGAEMVDVHLSVGTTERNGIALILITCLGRMFAIYTIGLHRVTEDDGCAFAASVLERVRALRRD